MSTPPSSRRTPSAATIRAFAPISSAANALAASPATSSRRKPHYSARRLRSRKRSIIPTASRMRCTIAASATSLAAIARPPSRPPIARWRWRKSLGCCRGARAACCLAGWATAVGSGVAEAARLIDAEIDNATAAGPLPQYYLGLAAEVLLAAGRPADGLGSSRPCDRRHRRARRRFLPAGNLSFARRVPAGARPRQQGRGAIGLRDRSRHCQAPRRSRLRAPRRDLNFRDH